MKFQPDKISGLESKKAPIPIPNNIEELLSNQPTSSKEDGVVEIEIGRTNKWDRKIILPSGEEVYLAEIYLAKLLRDSLKARRNQKGELEIFDPKENKFVKFTINGFVRITGEKFQITGPDGQRYGVPQGAIFAEKYLPNLIQAGILNREDFRTTSASKTADVIGGHERKLQGSPYVQFGNKVGSVKYYIGRDKIVDTDFPLENCSVVQLDSNTAGIINNRHGKRRLLYTFRLLSPEETQKKRDEMEAEKSLTPSEMSARTVVGASEMKARMLHYDITNFFPIQPGEQPEEYAKRIAELNDIEFVTKEFRSFFAQAGIGAHNLDWSEQVALANAILEEKSKNRLVEFAKVYGLQGVRAFLSCRYEPNMSQTVLSLGEKLSKEIAQRIFAKYEDVLDITKQIENLTTEQATQVIANLLKKGNELLKNWADSADKQQTELISKQLEHIKAEVLLFASTFKVLSEYEKIGLSDLTGANFEIKDSSLLSDSEREEMARIYVDNRPNYPAELLKGTLRELVDALKGQNHEFQILRFNGEIIAFIRFDKLENGNIYTGSLNVRPEVRGSAIGGAMLRATLEKKAELSNVEAIVYEHNPMFQKYITDYGFKIVGELPDYKGSGQKFYKLEITRKSDANQDPTVSSSDFSQVA